MCRKSWCETFFYFWQSVRRVLGSARSLLNGLEMQKQKQKQEANTKINKATSIETMPATTTATGGSPGRWMEMSEAFEYRHKSQKTAQPVRVVSWVLAENEHIKSKVEATRSKSWVERIKAIGRGRRRRKRCERLTPAGYLWSWIFLLCSRLCWLLAWPWLWPRLGLALSLPAAWHALPSAGSIYGCVSCSCRRFIKMCSNTKTERRPEDSCLWHPRCGTTVSGSSSQLLSPLPPFLPRAYQMCAHLFIHIAGRAHQSTEMSYKTSIISAKCLFMFSTRADSKR